jgi:pilus assembly protein CpaE
MGTSETTLDLKKHRGAHGLLNCHVFAKREYLARLESPFVVGGHQSAALTLHAVASHEHLFLDALRQAQCVILEVDPKDELSLARMEQVRRARPNIPIIAAIEEADIKLTRVLIRQGVFDVVTLPFDQDEVLSRVMDASATVAADSKAKLAPMISVVGAVGGLGATTVITHLASAISARDQFGRCCILDLDLQFGEVANYLGLSPPTSVLDLVEAGDRLDEDLIRNSAIDSGRGTYVLAAPLAISPLEQVDLDRLLRLLDIVREEFDFVLVDLPSSWTNWSLSALLGCSEIVLLTDQTINGLRQTKRCLDLFDSVEVPAADVTVVVNRYEKRLMQKIGLGDVSRVLERPVAATLALDKNGLSEAQDQGRLINETVRKTRFYDDVTGLAEDLCSRMSDRS